MKRFPMRLLAVTWALALGATMAQAQTTTKDIVLDRVSAPLRANAPAAPAGDAMIASVLQESADGTLKPRGTDHLFHTGDRFRVKVLTARDARILLFNTKPSGELVPRPIWQGDAKVGQELVTPRLRLEGQSGIDQLHVVMQPVQETGIVAWLQGWLVRFGGSNAKAAPGAEVSKDIVLDVQNTESATYLLNGRGQGLVTTIRIAHR